MRRLKTAVLASPQRNLHSPPDMSEGISQCMPASQYMTFINRTEELARMEAQAAKRKSMLIFGAEGAGKTRLLQVFAAARPLALYVGQIRTPRDLMLALIEDIRRAAKRELHLPSNPKSLSTFSLKGFVQNALDQFPFLLVLDHMAGPSRVVTGIVKEMNYYGRTPVFFAARTPHMEDIGTLQPMCADRSERTELKNWPAPIALEFARRAAISSGLEGSNLDQALHSFVEWSDGNPGGILRMLKMAQSPEYRLGDQIKTHVLYLDSLLGSYCGGKASKPDPE